MSDVASGIAAAFDEVWRRFLDRLDGLDDEEYFWEPVADCWSVRIDGDGLWRIDGNGGDGGPTGAPVPPPFTTIAWRIGHIGLTLLGFGDRLFFEGEVTLDDVRFASSAPAAADFLEDTYRHFWRDPLAGIDPDDWLTPIGPVFGPYASSSTLDLTLHVLDELIHHGAEVGLLRDLYRYRDSLGPPVT